jgi:hypothetical protein
MPKSIYGVRQSSGNGSGGATNVQEVASKIGSINSRLVSIMSQMTEEGANKQKDAIQERLELLRRAVRTMK